MVQIATWKTGKIPGPEGCDQEHKVQQAAMLHVATCNIPQGSVMGLILFYASICNLKTEHTLSKFANDIKL